MDKDIKAVAIYYVILFLIAYGQAFIFFFGGNQLMPFEMLGLSFLLFCLLLLLTYLISKFMLSRWNRENYGWTSHNLSKSFLWVSALLSPLTLGSLLAALFLGPEDLMSWWAIGIQEPYPLWIPLFGVIYWFLSGLISFSFWQAFPYELLKDYPEKYTIPIVSILFILLYNRPLLTGAFRPIDIIWLGIIFPVLYTKYRNSPSLILGYLFLFEGPVLWCFGVIFGRLLFVFLLSLRALWCMVAILILFLHRFNTSREIFNN